MNVGKSAAVNLGHAATGSRSGRNPLYILLHVQTNWISFKLQGVSGFQLFSMKTYSGGYGSGESLLNSRNCDMKSETKPKMNLFMFKHARAFLAEFVWCAFRWKGGCWSRLICHKMPVSGM